MALGMTVFVTVLMFGIHFTEVMMAQMKVTEAGASTMWDITAGKMHHWGLVPSTSETDTTVAAAQAMGQARYANFDGRAVSAQRRTTPTMSQVLTSAGNMQITCQVGAGLDFFPTYLLPQFRLTYVDREGVQCNAQADIVHGGMGGKVGGLANDANGLFKAKTFDARTAAATGTYRSCAMGRGQFGGCNQPMRMLVDDWGMSNGNGDEASICPVIIFGIPCVGGNLPYWYSVNKLYTPMSLLFGVQSGADRTLITSVYGMAPFWIPLLSSPTSFYLSFTGEETLFMTMIPWGTDNGWFSLFWQTSPFAMWPTYAVAYGASNGNYLGQGSTSTPARP